MLIEAGVSGLISIVLLSSTSESDKGDVLAVTLRPNPFRDLIPAYPWQLDIQQYNVG
jgi:hypothetical protein